MMLRLSKQEKLGGRHPDFRSASRYDVNTKAPRRMQRAVDFYNTYADEPDRGFKSNQDWPVFGARTAVAVAMVVSLFVAAKLTFATLGDLADLGATSAIVAVVALLIN